MARYGNRRETATTLAKLRIQENVMNFRDQDWNGARTNEVADYVMDEKNGIEDFIVGDSACMILAKDRDSAKKLWTFAAPQDDESFGIADEVDWLKVEDRWWLTLWWD